MIDRLELFTSRPLVAEYAKKFEGIPAYRSKLIQEDEDIQELSRSDMNFLYKSVYTETLLGKTDTGEEFDDPVTFYIFSFPRFKRRERDRHKIVCNPSKISASDLRTFLTRRFWKRGDLDMERFFSSFRLGRVDFAFDVRTHTPEDLKRTLYWDRKVRKHIGLWHISNNDPDGVRIRTISEAQLQTLYIGKSKYVLRIYDKVAESKNQVSVCKREGWRIPEKLQALADEKLVTRIEMQIRDLGRSGFVVDDEGNKEWNPTRPHHQLKTLHDILHLDRNNFDVFADLAFAPRDFVVPGTYESWKWHAFNSHIEKVGLDQALKILPANTRKEVRSMLSKNNFPYDLDQKVYEEIRLWLES